MDRRYTINAYVLFKLNETVMMYLPIGAFYYKAYTTYLIDFSEKIMTMFKLITSMFYNTIKIKDFDMPQRDTLVNFIMIEIKQQQQAVYLKL